MQQAKKSRDGERIVGTNAKSMIFLFYYPFWLIGIRGRLIQYISSRATCTINATKIAKPMPHNGCRSPKKRHDRSAIEHGTSQYGIQIGIGPVVLSWLGFLRT
jgi:hypothetical protein